MRLAGGAMPFATQSSSMMPRSRACAALASYGN
jgi:hypothetical protein